MIATLHPTFSDNSMHEATLGIIASWAELNDSQLRYLLTLLSTYDDPVEIATLFLFRTNDIEVERAQPNSMCADCRYQPEGWIRPVRFTLSYHNIIMHVEQLQWIQHSEDFQQPLRFISNKKLQAIDTQLHTLSFGQYLNCEKYYYGYANTQHHTLIPALAAILYRQADGSMSNTPPTLTPAETLNTILWYTAAKRHLAQEFPHYFRPTSDAEQNGNIDIMKMINSQIRALTSGDITIEDRILAAPLYRALTELEAKIIDQQSIKSKNTV